MVCTHHSQSFWCFMILVVSHSGEISSSLVFLGGMLIIEEIPWKHGDFHGIISGKLTVCYGKWPSRNSGFTHQHWWFSIVMWQFTRPGISQEIPGISKSNPQRSSQVLVALRFCARWPRCARCDSDWIWDLGEKLTWNWRWGLDFTVAFGKRLQKTMENHHVSWVNPLFRLGHVQ